MDTRTKLLRTALTVFVEQGYEASTLHTIRERASISNGSLFHFFRSKEALGAALYLEGIVQYQQGLLAVLASPPADAASGVEALVGHHLRWVEANVELARFLFERGRPDWGPNHADAVRTANGRVFQALGDWLSAGMQAGQLREQPLTVALALLQGATHALCRAWMDDARPGKLIRHTAALSHSLWAALRAEHQGRPA